MPVKDNAHPAKHPGFYAKRFIMNFDGDLECSSAGIDDRTHASDRSDEILAGKCIDINRHGLPGRDAPKFALRNMHISHKRVEAGDAEHGFADANCVAQFDVTF